MAFNFSGRAQPMPSAKPSVFRFGATENIPTQVDASPRSWNAARLAVQKNHAEQAAKMAAEQASAATEGGWVNRVFGIAPAKDKEAGLRAAQAAAMLAGHSYIEKAQAEAKAQAAMAAEAEEAAAAARQEAQAQADAYAREAELEARVAAQLRESRAAAPAAPAAAAAPVLDLGSVAAKLSAAPAAQPAAAADDFEFGDFEAAPAPVEAAAPVEEPAAEEEEEEAPVEAVAKEPVELVEAPTEAVPAEEPMAAAEVARGLLSPEAQEAARLKQVVWSDGEDDGDDEKEGDETDKEEVLLFKPALKVVILAKEDSFEADAGALRTAVSLGMAPPPKSGGKRPRTPAPPTPVARRTRAGRKAASMEVTEAPAAESGAGQKRGRKSSSEEEEEEEAPAVLVAEEAADEVAPRATRRQRCAA